MKVFEKLLTQVWAKKISKFMKIMCYVTITLLVTVLILSAMGRLQYNLKIDGGENYPHAIYAEENHNFSTRSFTVNTRDNLYIRTQSEDGKIELISYIALVLMYACGIIPLIFSYYFLAKLFDNVSKGEIFIGKNAYYLLYYGIIQGGVAILLPFVKMLIVQIANMLVADQIFMSTGSNMINQVIPSFGFLVAAYIINYGVNLQDEVDHTI